MNADHFENPYEAPRAALPLPDGETMPPAMLLVFACYLAHALLELVPQFSTSLVDFELFVPTMAGVGLYCVAICIALWRRQQWARVWLVLTTVFAVFLLGRMLWSGVTITQWHAVLAHLLRIAVAVMLFLPSVRCWFAPRRV